GSGSAPESERPERVSTSRQPTLTTWTDPEDDIVYIDVPAYPPPAPPAQTPPLPECSFGSLPVSPAPSIVPLPISSPMIPLTVPSPVATPATTKTEGFLTELGAQESRVRVGESRSDIWGDMETSVSPGVMGRSVECTEGSFMLAEVVDKMRRGQEPRGDA
ncbi:hypothetical protein Tco_1445099, partial [Tanacetum coccineum]